MLNLSVEGFLEQEIGLDIKSVGHTLISQAVFRRMQACHLNENAYLRLLQNSDEEQELLIDAVVIPETSFFRNHKAFEFLAEVVSERAKKGLIQPLKILCMPCSTGEEAYSLAMTLFTAGLSSDEFQIDAIDICEPVLAHARTACYSASSFRTKVAKDAQQDYFSRSYMENGQVRFHVLPSVQAQVNFRQGNLLSSTILAHDEQYPFIFCRNLLIYFTAHARKHAIKKLENSLQQDGLLFVGHAERSLITQGGFEPVPRSGVFACRRASCTSKRAAKPGMPLPASPVKMASMPAQIHSTGISRQAKPIAAPSQQKKVTHCGNAKQTDLQLEQAQVYADQGELGKALHLCLDFLASQPTSITGHFLCGVIYQAQDIHDLAEKSFQRVLYLNPEHQEALQHLIFLAEQHHAYNVAAQYRKRLQRLRQKQS